MLLFEKFRGLNTFKSAIIFFVLSCSFLTYNNFANKIDKPAILEKDDAFWRTNMAMQFLELEFKNEDLRELIYVLTRFQLDLTAAQNLIDNFESKLEEPKSVNTGPNVEYEILRRRVRQNTDQLWNYIRSTLNKTKLTVSKDRPDLADKIKDVLELGAEHRRTIISNIDRMRMVDGHEQWRHDEAKSLSDLVWKRLDSLQNPKDCKKARKLICNLPKNYCGYGCVLHHYNYCFILAYSTERTLILKSNEWKYPTFPWDYYFEPLSEKCLDVDPTISAEEWPGENDAQVLQYNIGEGFVTWPPYLPLSIPSDLAPRLMRLQRDPGAWWVSQFLKYLLRPRKSAQEMFEARMKKLGFKKPIVGVQIRRSDKILGEATIHSIEEYMTHVEDYFLKLEMNGKSIKRRVFLATDEASVIIEARKKYPSYEIIAETHVARIAGDNRRRYTDESLKGIVSDVYILSSCDYIVCTLSSNICRTLYEIFHTKYVDASNRVHSLDEIYFYALGKPHNSEAVISHYPRDPDEIDFNLGDQIEIDVDMDSNHWDGYSKGRNTRTNQTGLLPLFKVIDKVLTVKLPTYSNVK